jgi:hypothetical protein
MMKRMAGLVGRMGGWFRSWALSWSTTIHTAERHIYRFSGSVSMSTSLIFRLCVPANADTSIFLLPIHIRITFLTMFHAVWSSTTLTNKAFKDKETHFCKWYVHTSKSGRAMSPLSLVLEQQ